MWLSLKNYLKNNWKSILGFCAGILLWILIKENTLGLWGYLLFGSIDFDGSDDFVSLPSGVDISGGDFSISIWFKTDNNTSERALVAFGNTGNNTPFLQLYIGNVTGGIAGIMRDDSNTLTFVSTSADDGVTIGKWHLGLFQREGNVFSIGLDGNILATDTIALGTTTLNTFNIGKLGRIVSSNFFDGQIDEGDIWSEALSVDEIAQLYNSRVKGIARQVQPANLVASWSMDDGPDGTSADGDTVIDGAGNGNDGTGDNGANDTGLIWKAEEILSYPSNAIYVISVVTPPVAGAIMNQFQGPNLGADLFNGTLIV